MEQTGRKGVSAFLAALFALVLAALLLPAAAWADSTYTWDGDDDTLSDDGTTITITGDGTLTITADTTASIVVSSGTVSIVVEDGVTLTSDSSHTVYIASGATVTLSGGTYANTANDSSNAGKAVVWNEGTCTIESGTYDNESSVEKAYYTIVNNGTMTISDGEFTGDADASNSSLVINSQDYEGASLSITGGTFTTLGSACVKNDTNGTLTITGGTFDNDDNYGIVNYGVATVSNATITGKRGIYNDVSTDDENETDNSLTVSSCTITTTSYTIWNYSGEARATVSDCTLTSDDYAVVNTGEKLVVEDSTISGTLGVYTSGSNASTRLNDCTVTASKYYAIYNKNGQTTVAGGTYTAEGDYDAVYNSGTGGGISVLHGDFSDDSAKDYLATTLVTVTDEDGNETTVMPDAVISVTTDDGTEVHALVAVDAEDATCTEPGTIAYYYCAYCGDYFTASTSTDDDGNTTTTYTEASEPDLVVSATGHSYVSEVTTEATCTEDGVTTYTCSVCGDTYTEAIAATGHTAGEAVVEVVIEGDCTTEGFAYSRVYCTVCGAELESEEVVTEATGHSWIVYYVEVAEDGSSAVVYLICEVCDEDLWFTADTLTSVDNGDGTVTYTATATYGGVEYTGTATVESAVEGDTDEEEAHSYAISGIVFSSDYSSATVTLVCADCGESVTVEGTVVATANEDGSTTYTVTATYEGAEYTYAYTVAAESDATSDSDSDDEEETTEESTAEDETADDESDESDATASDEDESASAPSGAGGSAGNAFAETGDSTGYALAAGVGIAALAACALAAAALRRRAA